VKKKLYTSQSRFFIALLALSTVASPAWSQSAQLPGTVSPGRINQQFQSAPSRPGVSTAPVTKEGLPGVDVPEASRKIFLTLNELKFDGVTAFKESELLPYYQSLIGERIPLSKIYEVAAAITNKYHADGYVFAQVAVPDQKIAGGVVRLVVIEGYLGKVNVEAPKAMQEKLRTRVERILAARPFNANILERQLLLLNDLYGISVRSVLKPDPAAATPGAVDVTLLVKKEKPSTSLSFDNYGSRPLGQEQVGAQHTRGLGLFSFDKLTLGGFISTQMSELQYIFLGYEVPVSAEGTKLGFSVNNSWTEPGYPLENNELEGKAFNASATLSHPFIRSRSQNLTLAGIFDYQDIENDALQTLLFEDKIRVGRLNAIYDVADDWQGTNLMNMQVSQGLDIFGATETGSANLSREDAHSDFIKLQASAARWQYLSPAWTLYASASGQISDAPLPSSEEFGYGGQVYGRAYNPSEITGDEGIAALVEMRYTDLPPTPWGGDVEPFAFYDIGVVYNEDNFVENRSVSGASAGLGARFDVTEDINGTLTLAFPLTLPVGIPSPGGNPSNGRLFFSLGYDF
jgi:hemolysin activation/secretion protein